MECVINHTICLSYVTPFPRAVNSGSLLRKTFIIFIVIKRLVLYTKVVFFLDVAELNV